jgi:hypothetical protein
MIITLVGCVARTPREYFNRPYLKECITLIQDGATLGMMSCNGKTIPIPSRLTIPKAQSEFETARRYYEKREYGHYICLKFPSKCNNQ